MKYPVLVLVAGTLIAATPTLQTAPTPPPTPPPLTQTQTDATPVPTATPNLDTILSAPVPLPRGKEQRSEAKGPKSVASPEPERKGLDGVWEVQIQRGPKTEYEHMYLIQTGQTITGYYLTQQNVKYPVTGSVDTSNVRLVVSLTDGSTILLEARLDGTTDMLGMFTDAKERVPFTAAYRPKEKWTDNINATPGGLGGGLGSGPP